MTLDAERVRLRIRRRARVRSGGGHNRRVRRRRPRVLRPRVRAHLAHDDRRLLALSRRSVPPFPTSNTVKLTLSTALAVIVGSTKCVVVYVVVLGSSKVEVDPATVVVCVSVPEV